ncbi:spore germination protein [Sutcliffiella horikoshii]|uniref:spore germination protein n=1 Tax=Sutcliffiella horikoshii TaxID=79883 RepID=UPI0038513C0E
MITPSLFIEAFPTPDDYYFKAGRLTTRTIRFFGFFLSVFLPAIYVTLAKSHQNEYSEKIVKSLFSDGELLPPFWEMAFLMFLLKILTDASFRIPKGAIILLSLVATIVIGETAVTANLIFIRRKIYNVTQRGASQLFRRVFNDHSYGRERTNIWFKLS